MTSESDNLDLERHVIETFRRHFGLPREALLPSRSLGDLGVDSLTLVTALFELEESLGLDLLAAEIQLGDITTLADVIQLVRRLKGAK